MAVCLIPCGRWWYGIILVGVPVTSLHFYNERSSCLERQRGLPGVGWKTHPRGLQTRGLGGNERVRLSKVTREPSLFSAL